MNETRFILIARPAHFFNWSEMSAREQALCSYSDTHKEAYGFRPRHLHPDCTAGQIARLEKMAIREIFAQAQWERDLAKRNVVEANKRAHAARVEARKLAASFSLGARWPKK